jgi:hypothetical protein
MMSSIEAPVRPPSTTRKVGPVDLLHDPAPTGSTPEVITYHADPGSPSEENLRLLASLAT